MISRIRRAREIMPGCTPRVKAMDFRSPMGRAERYSWRIKGSFPLDCKRACLTIRHQWPACKRPERTRSTICRRKAAVKVPWQTEKWQFHRHKKLHVYTKPGQLHSHGGGKQRTVQTGGGSVQQAIRSEYPYPGRLWPIPGASRIAIVRGGRQTTASPRAR